jgi:hypothetical protein
MKVRQVLQLLTLFVLILVISYFYRHLKDCQNCRMLGTTLVISEGKQVLVASEAGSIDSQGEHSFIGTSNANGSKPGIISYHGKNKTSRANGLIISNFPGVDNGLQDSYNDDVTVMMSPKPIGSPDMNESQKIPHKLHIMWRSRYVPKTLMKFIKTWVDNYPLWEFWFWTQECGEKLVQKIYPEHLAIYRGYPHDVQRADVRRYYVLHTFGGIYADGDMESLKPIDDVISQHPCILSQEPDTHAYIWHKRNDTITSNALMACRPNHPFFQEVIASIPRAAKHTGLLESTGPFLLHIVMKTYKNVYFTGNRTNNSDNGLFLAPWDWFQPTIDPTIVKDVKSICKKMLNHTNLKETFTNEHVFEMQMTICKRLEKEHYRNTPYNYSYTQHHWLHMYWHHDKYSSRMDSDLNVDIAKIIPNIRFGSDIVRQMDK